MVENMSKFVVCYGSTLNKPLHTEHWSKVTLNTCTFVVCKKFEKKGTYMFKELKTTNNYRQLISKQKVDDHE